MNEKETSRVIHDFLEAYLKQDVDKTLSFLTEDVVWIQPEGTFKGKNEVKHLLSWLPQSFWWGRMKFRDTGVGILVNGDKAVHEYMIEGVSSEEAGYEARAVSIYEFRGEKIQQHRWLCDRMAVGKQACRGVVRSRIIDGILNTWEGGLR